MANRHSVQTNIAYDETKQLYYVTLDFGKDISGKRIKKTKTFKTLKEAKKVLAEHNYKKEKNKLILPSTYTLEEYSNMWINNHATIYCKKLTVLGYRYMLDKHINKILGKIPLQKINLPIIKQYIEQIKTTTNLSNVTINKHLELLHTIFNSAIEDELLSENIIDNVKKLRPDTNFECTIYEPDEINELLSAAKSSTIELPVKLALMCGLRRGEINGLKWCNVDLEKKVFRIKETVLQGNTSDIHDTPKSIRSKRNLSIPDNLLPLLIQTKNDQEENKKLLLSDYHDNNLVFCKVNGDPYKATYISTQFKKLISKTNLKHARFHDLRHMFASYALDSGVSYTTLSGMMGHSKPSVTLDIYTHLLKNHSSTIANKVCNHILECDNI